MLEIVFGEDGEVVLEEESGEDAVAGLEDVAEGTIIDRPAATGGTFGLQDCLADTETLGELEDGVAAAKILRCQVVA